MGRWCVGVLILLLFLWSGVAIAGDQGTVVAGLGRDPGTAYNYGAHPPLTRVLEPLIFRDLDLGLIPGLARDWQVSEDGLTWELLLQEDVSFHDGTPLTAQAVVQNLERIQRTWPGRLGPVESIQAIGDEVVELVHESPFAPFLYTLAWPGAAMISPDAVDENDKVLEPVGTGPFFRTSWTPDEEMILLQNPFYWGQTPQLQKIVLKVIPDSTTRMMALEAGEIDMIIDTGGVLPEQVATLEKNEEIQILTVAGAVPHYMVFNTQKPPFDDLLIRQAVMKSLDPDLLIQYTLEGYGKAMTSLIPYSEKDWMHPQNLYAFQDPAGAAALLQEAGWEEGKEIRVRFLLASGLVGRWPYQPIAEVVQYQLQELGILVDIEVVETGLFWEMLRKGEAHLSIRPWAGISPYTRLYDWLHSTGSNTLSMGIFYENPTLDQLLDALLQTTQIEEARELAFTIQELAAREVPLLPIYDEVLINAVRSDIAGYVLHPWFTVNWEDIYRR